MAKVNLDGFKQEVASQLGIEVGAEQTARNNGKVGGNMVKKMVEFAEKNLAR